MVSRKGKNGDEDSDHWRSQQPETDDAGAQQDTSLQNLADYDFSLTHQFMHLFKNTLHNPSIRRTML